MSEGERDRGKEMSVVGRERRGRGKVIWSEAKRGMGMGKEMQRRRRGWRHGEERKGRWGRDERE